MANYSTEKGFTIQSYASDPFESLVAAGTWTTANNLLTARAAATGSGSQTAAIVAGGTPPTTGKTETYNGTSWTEQTDMNTARDSAASADAPSTAALVFAGDTGTYPTVAPVAVNEYWNGSTWTELADLNTARRSPGGAGTAYTAALCFGGYTTTVVNNTESWNGTSWTETNNLNLARYYVGGTGSTTAAICAGGDAEGETELWNGTSWSEAPVTPGSAFIILFGADSSNVIGTGQSPTAQTNSWNGTTWTALPSTCDLNTGRAGGMGGGTNTAGIYASGGGPSNATEDWNVPSGAVSVAQEGQVWYNSTTTVLKSFGQQGTGAWASIASCNNARQHSGSTGTSTSAVLMFAGEPAPVKYKTELWNGSAWTELADTNTGRTAGMCGGTSTAAVLGGGADSYTTNSETWNGTSWAEGGNTTAPARAVPGWTGASTADVMGTGGTHAPIAFNTTDRYDGTSWAASATLTRASCYGMDGATAAPGATALIIGGIFYPPSTITDITESFNGTSWSELNDLNTGRYYAGGAGTSTAAMEVGGYSGPTTMSAKVEFWDGTSWTEGSALATATTYACASGNGLSQCIGASGKAPSLTTDCFEYAIPDATKTFSSS